MANFRIDSRHSLSHSFVQKLMLLAYFCVPSLSLPASISRFELPGNNVTCVNIFFDSDDYSVKPARVPQAPICEAHSIGTGDLIFGRQVTQLDDYTCSESKPCRNGACCPKATGFCNYGPEYCGTNNQSPNEVCWNNCDAKAECGRFADPVGKECPLNVCCGPWGFCGMTEEFCTVSDDEEKSCQSNCEQPGSGRSGGDVRQRVIGYYEMWVHERACNGMSINQIPVGALTHLMFSFAYISPGDFNIVPMDDLPEKLFRDFAALKKKNSALKIMVALGGWTFNDPGPTQTVFHDVCASSASRAKFIANLLSFFRQFGFDGVDFDWEYPGADDRGGAEEDGVNFTKLLEELNVAIKTQPIPYVVSFTTPTSFWYLRHFDLKASTAAVDFVNIMSYDLHGVWDAWNPIGSNVLGHSNLTEIKLALDLYWRNGIPAEKLNLGIGFYGRSFQLSDPTCYTPGCKFLGGAAPGPCTKNSGTLAYREIVDIIKEKNIKPYYVKEDEIKYIVWNQDQWISYDDEETIHAKIDWANEQGLGGLLIWSIDQDTDDLQALTAVVGKEVIALAMTDDKGKNADYWKSIGSQACYTTDCGGSCNPGFIKITQQPCGGAKPVTRHSKEADSSLCCPLTSAPNPDNCEWRGTAPSCNGRCHDGEVAMQLNRWGDGKYCEDGNKAYCCSVPQGRNNQCYWSGMGKSCRSGDKPLTFAGTFLSDIADFAQFFGIVGDALSDMLNDLDMELEELYCCPPDDIARWGNCQWYGKPGSCSDNHCALNTQVQMATNRYGLGESCSPRLERARVFCCDPPDGEALFPPVPLEWIFKNPPTGDEIDTKFELKIDNSWGDGTEDTDTDDDPDEAAVSFYIMVAPDEVQTSLDKRDGSHWEVFNCKNENEEEQTVQIVCTNVSNESNCDHISRGDGVPGTIIGMPKGCGPGKYAVAVSMKPAGNQTLPHHLYKRLDHVPVVYDLTFDYRFDRVPRQFGETQLRVDYSNQVGYWDNMVAKAAETKAKRSLEEMGGNHKRWLEDEFRDDMHSGGLSKDELHKRWFGEDIVSWLRGLLNGGITPEFRHDYTDKITAIILQEDWECQYTPTTKFSANIDAVASADVKISTSFGFTLVTTLAHPIDFSNSFLHFNNKGEISAIFTIDAAAKVEFDSKLIHLANVPLPGAGFRVPGVMTVGPQFNLDARVKAGIAISGHVEAKVEIASWEIRQTMPEQSSEFEPKTLDEPSRNMDVSGLKQPEFDASVEALGYIEAHLLPTLSFGIKVDDTWNVGACSVDLVADGWVRLRAKSDLVGGDCGLAYAVDAGARLVAKATVPDAFKTWQPQELAIAAIDRTLIPSDGTEWKCLTNSESVMRRELNNSLAANPNILEDLAGKSTSSAVLQKRATTYGPIFKLPKLGCPLEEGGEDERACSEIFGADDEGQYGFDEVETRDILFEDFDMDLEPRNDSDLHWLEKRNTKTLHVCPFNKQTIKFPNWAADPTHVIVDNADWSDCNNYAFGVQAAQQNVPSSSGRASRYLIEHVLEGQMLQQFVAENFEAGGAGSICDQMGDDGWKIRIPINGVLITPWDFVASAYPSTASNNAEFFKLIEPLNLAKEHAFQKENKPIADKKMSRPISTEATLADAIIGVKKVMMLYKYMAMPTVRTIYLNQALRVQANFATAEAALAARDPTYRNHGLSALWRTWARGWTTMVITKLDTFFDTWVPLIEDVIPAPDPAVPDSPFRAALRVKVATMRTEVDARLIAPATWTNPL